jgi:hypothetical protein
MAQVENQGFCVVCHRPISTDQIIVLFNSKKYHEDCLEQEELFKKIKEEIKKGKFKLAS